MTKIDINALESERDDILRFFKKQLERYRELKRQMEKVQWYDANYDATVDALNAIGRALSEAISTLSDGYGAYIIDDLIPLAKDYLSVARDFPKI
ncbi:MAG: hypothetical protein II984_04505 [Clostridia bacterium]|nr:hypothetical protein [Clostridia bacterium]